MILRWKVVQKSWLLTEKRIGWLTPVSTHIH